VADPRGFLTVTERELPARRPVEVRILDYKEIEDRTGWDGAVLRRQASRCMNCGIPFCHSGCPLGNLIPEWNDLTWRGDTAGAVERLHATNNFPDFTGRLCPAPCEYACTLGINQPPITIRSIEHSLADTGFDDDLITPQVPAVLTGSTVAVVGSGPAGLAAAQQLTRAGHTVAVFEKDDRPGGLLRYGIPEFKLEKAILDRRLAQMEAEGTRFRTGVDVGADVTGPELLESYDAVVIAMGTPQRRDLGVPGRELRGIHQALDYLTAATREVHGGGSTPISAEGRDVVIIGGGDTGADCLGTAIRQGAASVTSIEIMPAPPSERPADQPWPAYPRLYKVASAHEEGGERIWAASTLEMLDDGEGRVGSLRISEVRFEGGRPVPVEGAERIIPAELVLLAMGFTGVAPTGLVEQLGLTLDARGRIERDNDWSAGVPGVFVAGDSGRGQSLIVWAIAEGRSAAASVDRYLCGTTGLPSPITPSQVQYRP
jgi:glutamate synthase, NADH/NADPH, small subunit